MAPEAKTPGHESSSIIQNHGFQDTLINTKLLILTMAFQLEK
jgi:hypothetical protein